MEQLLKDVHKLLGVVGGEIAVAIVCRRVHGGKTTLEQWAKNLREAARMIEEKLK